MILSRMGLGALPTGGFNFNKAINKGSPVVSAASLAKFGGKPVAFGGGAASPITRAISSVSSTLSSMTKGPTLFRSSLVAPPVIPMSTSTRKMFGSGGTGGGFGLSPVAPVANTAVTPSPAVVAAATQVAVDQGLAPASAAMTSTGGGGGGGGGAVPYGADDQTALDAAADMGVEPMPTGWAALSPMMKGAVVGGGLLVAFLGYKALRKS